MSSPSFEIVAVEFVNQERRIINFVKDESTFGFFNYPEQLKTPRIGDLLKVKLAKGNNNYYKALHISPASSNDICKAIKSFKGKVTVSNKNGFGFVDDVFLYPQLMKKFNLKDGVEVSGKAIYSFDKKKNSWGWKSFWISTNSAED